MLRYQAREKIWTELRKAGVYDILDRRGWNHPLRKTEIILRCVPDDVYRHEEINNMPKNEEEIKKWRIVLEIMQRIAPSEDTKRALALYGE